VAADARQEARQRGRFEQARAQRVGHQHLAGAHRAEQAGHAEGRVGAQLDRVAEVVVEAAQDGVHALEARDGLEEDGVVAHREVLPSTSGKPR
jgi:hypothetical protein